MAKTPSKRQSGRGSKSAAKANSNIFDCFEKAEVEEFKAVRNAHISVLYSFVGESIIEVIFYSNYHRVSSSWIMTRMELFQRRTSVHPWIQWVELPMRETWKK